MYNFDLSGAITLFFGMLFIAVPLAIWKVVDLLVLLSQHVSLRFH